MDDLEKQTINLSQCVKSICTSFFERYGINGFSYSKVFSDGSRAELWSNAEALSHTFLKKKYIASTYTPKNYSTDERHVHLASKIESCPKEIAEMYRNQLVDQKNLFDHDNCFMIVEKDLEFSEYYIFYTPSAFKSAINFYFNKLDKLENFTKLFKEEAKDLCGKATENKIVKPWIQVENPRKIKIIDRKLNLKEYNDKLSCREYEVARYILNGNTAKEIANNMNISYRTVESYILESPKFVVT